MMQLKFSGTSHSEYITLSVGADIKGFLIDHNLIKSKIKARSSSFYFNTNRQEEDIYTLEGVVDDIVIDNSLCIKVYNKDVKSKDYMSGVIRPSHGDIVGYQVLGHDFDFAGGGVHSGRLTVLYVILGAILENNMDNFAMYKQIKQVNNLIDDDIRYTDKLDVLKNNTFPVLNSEIRDKMLAHISSIHKKGDSIGAKLTFRIDGLKVGTGGFYFDSFESILSKYIFGIGGIKGIEFGEGFSLVNKTGSTANDSYYVDNGKIKSVNNLQGGLNAGFVNAIEPIIFSVIVRPTPTILQPQDTVRLNENNEFENYRYNAIGRHDSFFANRVIAVVEACVYMALFDMEEYA